MRRFQFSVPTATIGLTLTGLALTSCSVPGGSRTEILSRETVSVGGRSCQYVSRSTETNTINGIHRYVDGVISCNGKAFQCNQSTRDQCVAGVAASLDARG